MEFIQVRIFDKVFRISGYSYRAKHPVNETGSHYERDGAGSNYLPGVVGGRRTHFEHVVEVRTLGAGDGPIRNYRHTVRRAARHEIGRIEKGHLIEDIAYFACGVEWSCIKCMCADP